MESKWYIYTKRADFNAISARFGIDPVTARVLVNRGIKDEADISFFLHADLDSLYDERLLPDIDRACETISRVIGAGGLIRVVGDYDIDGVCATYILLKGLEAAGARVDYRIPDRIRDGYGLNLRIVEEAVRDSAALLVTCDNGIAALEELDYARKCGLRTVVTDHHNIRLDSEGKELLPQADAVVDVKRKDSRYPTSEICGAVTAWKLIRRLYAVLGRDGREWLRYIEFAAVATVGDIMELTGENRIIVREGLRVLNGGIHPDGSGARGSRSLGMRVLLQSLGLENKNMDAFHIGFVLGPCINAGGRLRSAEIALRLFISEDEAEAARLAEELISLNIQRKNMTEQGVRAGMELLADGHMQDRVLVVYIPDLHESLAGIVAGRLKDSIGKPAIVFAKGAEGLKGSGRSIDSYDMFAALSEASDLLLKYGGHKLAAGLSIAEESLDALRERLNSRADLKDEDFVKKVWIDAAVPFGYISEKLAEELESLGPFGQGFERPVFAGRNIRLLGLRVMGKQKNALSMRLADESGCVAEGIMFGDAEALCARLQGAGSLRILYHLRINEFGGRKRLQLEIKDFGVS